MAFVTPALVSQEAAHIFNSYRPFSIIRKNRTFDLNKTGVIVDQFRLSFLLEGGDSDDAN